MEVPAYNPKAVHMRNITFYAICFHLTFAFISLGLIGFLPMLEDFILAAIAFSCYLTLYDWVISTYIISLGFSIIFGFLQFFKYESISFLYFFFSDVLYFIVLYNIGQSYN